MTFCFNIDTLRTAKKARPNWVFLLGDKEKNPQLLVGKWKELKAQTNEELEVLIKRVEDNPVEAWNYGPKTGLNNLVCLDWDWEFLAYRWLKKFGSRAQTETIRTPNLGYRMLFDTTERENDSPYKQSLHMEFENCGYVAIGGSAIDAEGNKGNYEKISDYPIRTDNAIIADTKEFLKEQLGRYDFLGYNCIKNLIDMKKHIKLNHEQRLAILQFMLAKDFEDDEIHDFFGTVYDDKGRDYDPAKTESQIGSGRNFKSRGGKPHPCTPKTREDGKESVPLYQIFGFDPENCRGCIRKKQTIHDVNEPEKTQDKGPKDKREKTIIKDSGILQNGCFEAAYNNGKPCFLVKNSENIRTVESLEVDGETYLPKEAKHIPYEPYGFYEEDVPSREKLFWKIRSEFDLFIDVESIWKDVFAACTLLTYHQEKLQTTPYLFLYGDNESGKTTILQILNWLAYRPMLAVTVPSADLYGYLESSDSIGVILEDEIQGIHKDLDKVKIYKSGYKSGAVVPRTLLTQNERIIKYYHTFCFKACASEQLSPVKGFNERFLFVPMVEGVPQKEWTDITKEDLARLHNLRNMLLKWRMLSRDWELPNIELTIKGRVKELWKPILQITSGLTVYDGLLEFVEKQRTERLESKKNTLEGHIVKVVVELHNELYKKAEEEKKPLLEQLKIPFHAIWTELSLDLDGKLNDNKPHLMDTSEFDQVTKNKVGYRLREVLSGEKTLAREKDEEGKETVVKAYTFDLEKLKRIAKKYGYDLVTKLPTLPSSESIQPPESMEESYENNGEKSPPTPQELGKLGNSVTTDLTVTCPYCQKMIANADSFTFQGGKPIHVQCYSELNKEEGQVEPQTA